MVEVAAEKNPTLVMPLPVELLRFFDRAPQSSGNGQASQVTAPQQELAGATLSELPPTGLKQEPAGFPEEPARPGEEPARALRPDRGVVRPSQAGG
ncbi:hypothetical protein AB0J63_47080 [Streptosporangium canum]|uniref:hypothetical protein n=1 Tax=Streptosporangium canum TaxID=324952 RepID=UPI00344096CC